MSVVLADRKSLDAGKSACPEEDVRSTSGLAVRKKNDDDSGSWTDAEKGMDRLDGEIPDEVAY